MSIRQLIRKTIRRILGLQALETAVADLTRELAETKGGVSGTQGQVGEILSHMIVLRHELAAKLAELTGRLEALQQRHREPDILKGTAAGNGGGDERRRELARALDSLGRKCLVEASPHAEAAAFAHWYALAADLVAKHWDRDGCPPLVL